MDYAQMKQEKDARFEEYKTTYAEQLRLQGYIESLEKDNENIMESMKTATTGRAQRHGKRLIKINNKDIKKYNKELSTMPPVPEFK